MRLRSKPEHGFSKLRILHSPWLHYVPSVLILGTVNALFASRCVLEASIFSAPLKIHALSIFDGATDCQPQAAQMGRASDTRAAWLLWLI